MLKSFSSQVSNINTPNDALIHGLTIGLGSGSISTNTALGYQAGYSNTTGDLNVFVGYQAGLSNTTGTHSTAIGYNAFLSSNGNDNTAVGYQAGIYSVGSANTLIGSQVGASISGSNNTAVGVISLASTSSGANNTAVGFGSLQANTTASNNTAVGYQAGYSNTTGVVDAFGYQAGYKNTTGSNSVYIGTTAGYNATTGTNLCVGNASGYNLTTGTGNTFVGTGVYGALPPAGYYVTTGSKNTIFGNYSGNQGGLDIRTASNYIVLSDGDGTVGAYYQTSGANGWYQNNNSTLWSITSDIRIKKNVVSLESGLDVISALKPVEFDYIENDKHDIGFIAQEYQEVLPAQVSEGEDGMLSLNQNLIPYLVKAIQELSAEVQSLKSKLGV